VILANGKHRRAHEIPSETTQNFDPSPRLVCVFTLSITHIVTKTADQLRLLYECVPALCVLLISIFAVHTRIGTLRVVDSLFAKDGAHRTLRVLARLSVLCVRISTLCTLRVLSSLSTAVFGCLISR